MSDFLRLPEDDPLFGSVTFTPGQLLQSKRCGCVLRYAEGPVEMIFKCGRYDAEKDTTGHLGHPKCYPSDFLPEPPPEPEPTRLEE